MEEIVIDTDGSQLTNAQVCANSVCDSPGWPEDEVLSPKNRESENSVFFPSISSADENQLSTFSQSDRSRDCKSSIGGSERLTVEPASGGNTVSSVLQSVNTTELGESEIKQALIEDTDQRIEELKKQYKEHILEFFYLDNGGNILTYNAWKKRPNPIRDDYLCQHKLEDDGDIVRPLVLKTVAQSTRASMVSTSSSPRADGVCSPPRGLRSPTVTTRRQSRVSRIDSAPAPSKEIVQQARHEAEIRRRTEELQQKNLSSTQRLAPVQEPARGKTHWDYLLEEMHWLSGDFVKERRWKTANARKLSKAIMRYHHDKGTRRERANRDMQQQLRRIASSQAKEVRGFWMKIHKVLLWQRNTLNEALRKAALEEQLNQVVDKTEKYSMLLAEGFAGATSGVSSTTASSAPSEVSEFSSLSSLEMDENEFVPEDTSDDDEVTIAKEEAMQDETAVDDEIAALQRESELPLDEIMPPDYLNERNWMRSADAEESESSEGESEEDSSESVSNLSSCSSDVESDVESGLHSTHLSTKALLDEDKGAGVDWEFSPEEESDDERTIAQEEEEEDKDAVADEVDELQREGELPLEELIRKYGNHREGVDEGSSSVAAGKENEVEMTDVGTKSIVEGCDDVVDGKDFVPDEDDDDDEQTIAQEEEMENDDDVASELNMLQQEGDLPLEDLLQGLSADYLNCEVPHSSSSDGSSQESSSTESESADNSLLVARKRKRSEGESEPATKKMRQGNSSEVVSEVSKQEKSSLTQHESAQDKFSTVENGQGPDELLTAVAQVAEELQPTGFTLSTSKVETPVPFLLKHTLREYQHIGLDWLATMHRRGLNGILADEMGLGKTIQTIALLAYLACQLHNWGPHLIVVPTSVMLNWELELKKWCPAFKILTYYGSVRERRQKRVGWTKPNTFHVCITSYKLALQDHVVLRRKKWQYLILDEAQHIKNFKSQRWQLLLALRSEHRLLLTGTPLQNSLMELWSLMHFLMPGVFASHQDFREWFANPLTGMIEGTHEYNHTIVQRLHKVLRPFLLRRLKLDVEKQLPQKVEHIVPCWLSKRQRYLYDDFMGRAKTKETLASTNFLSVINVLMQLRKVCNHPDLFEPRPIQSSFQAQPIVYTTASLALTPLLYEPFKHFDLSSLNFCLIDHEDLDPWCCSRSKQLQLDFDQISGESGSGGVFCPSTRGVSTSNCTVGHGGLRGNKLPAPSVFVLPHLTKALAQAAVARRQRLTTISHRRCSRRPIYGFALRHLLRGFCRRRCWQVVSDYRHEQSFISSPALVDGVLSCAPSGQAWLEDGVLASMLHTPEKRWLQLRDVFTRFILFVPSAQFPPLTLHVCHPPPHLVTHETRRTDALHKDLVARSTVLHQIGSGMMLNFPERRLIQYDCGKLQVLDILLKRLKTEQHRVLIFTQMTKMLDVLEIFLNFHGHTYLRLDGTTNVEKRQMLMDRFNSDTRIFCFILSTRSGGLGINLTGADTVVFYDSDWNPTMDAQAQDRCHRIGQTRDVHIYRLISEHTVEENILKKANQKRLLGDVAIEEGGFTTAFFKQDSLQDLFVTSNESLREIAGGITEQRPRREAKLLEEMLAEVEDETDALAAQRAQAEEAAEEAELHETFSPSAKEAQPRSATAELEEMFAEAESQMPPLDRYALNFLRNQLIQPEISAPARAKCRHSSAESRVGSSQQQSDTRQSAVDSEQLGACNNVT